MESNLKKLIVFSYVELLRDLQQVRERIEHEHLRLSQVQALLRADGNKVRTCTSVRHKLCPCSILNDNSKQVLTMLLVLTGKVEK